ncbi:hypothetical protein JQ561_28860 [Bradyrhizobium diazoefficiens]|nr:hypothetical protein [Bradyrhizobium diazoefficiens]MBR0930639.1 hypothetical protein [Bradyrhizobium diazoefficiens]
MTFMIDSPTPFESLELWEEYLNELLSVPDCALQQVAIEHAEQIIAEKKLELTQPMRVLGSKSAEL